ncbi:RNA polymerase sigma factor [Paenibacillus sp. J2TS4]|uniref:RNA polymerase sigma factor n=1 Tax=Paenibacillus sp. J2TS4 TaxID=2807194 RepID=UPI001B18168B|nr:sigma-70 family RNA polymerase sigma factor [Paenibacillus sp. J2TS4]GIP33292.1 DNA-directed RNA polymerase sigma-70 factor [Paenibacillus sp. J2TS4]
MQNMMDEQLMDRVRDKSRAALEELYDRYVRLVYSFALKSTRNEQSAKEIVQLVFTRLWTTEKGYQSHKGRFVSWLLTVTRNLTIDYIRKQRSEHKTISMDEMEWGRTPSPSSNSTENEVLRKMIRLQIQEAYRWLSASQIELLQQLYWEGYSLAEIARMRDEPLGTVKSRLHQTLKVLRKHLQIEWEG